ncbi:AAA family ATPase [Caproicibacterium lactatifermentans]|jgi:cytidylate kinase|nr:cytidylate kinase-like family protein [Caproicibacterium lactatifermentans]
MQDKTMQENRAKCMKLAERIYELDGEVYQCLGSSLGRVFTGSRDECVESLAELMCGSRKSYLLRSEMALVANMARTIPDEETRARLMAEYNNILVEIKSIPTSFGTVDILDESRAKLNAIHLHERFTDKDHLIVCISRTLGCAGTDIGFALANALKINFYDQKIFNTVLEHLDADKNSIEDISSANEVPNKVRKPQKGQTLDNFHRYHGLPENDAVFFNLSGLLCEMAAKEDFVVMGRCADVILTGGRIPHVSVFITAPFEQRVRRVMKTHSLDRKHASNLLKQLDHKRSKYYHFFTGRKWGDPENYDLCINSASYGIQGSVEMISRMIDQNGLYRR